RRKQYTNRSLNAASRAPLTHTYATTGAPAHVDYRYKLRSLDAKRQDERDRKRSGRRDRRVNGGRDDASLRCRDPIRGGRQRILEPLRMLRRRDCGRNDACRVIVATWRRWR